ncbi:hypothetical protein SNE510_07000 [Streptomyces sp. NE5-10]|nr:hypothetical protein SNE510_07000 [Streptomyces sp. NE5-10]
MSLTDDRLVPPVDQGPGNSAHLVDLGVGPALAVDASRDLRALRTAARRGPRVAFAAETPLHADLPGADRAEGLARAQYRSLRRLTELPDTTAAWPTHGALGIEFGALPALAADVPAGAVVACGHGERAMTAASLLERAGHTGIAVLDGGPADYAAAHDRKLVQGTGGSTA